MPKEILKPEAEENKFDEEEENASDLNKIVEEEIIGKEKSEKKGGKEIGIDTRTGEFLTEQDSKERREKGLEK